MRKKICGSKTRVVALFVAMIFCINSLSPVAFAQNMDNDDNDTVSAQATTELEILVQPEDVTLALGEVATFTVEVSGDGLSYRWQISKDDGETWSNTPTVSEQYSIKALEERVGWLWRCVVTDTYGNSVTSNEVTIIIAENLEIVTQPENVTLLLGAVATFTVEASGDGLSYRWQISKDDGETWSNTPTVSEQYSIKATEERAGWLYRCVITDAYGNSVTSNEVTMIIQQELKIVTQPEDVTLYLGEVATFTVEASGDELSYRWQISKDDGETWSNTPTVSEEYSIKALAARTGWLYRCVITDAYGNSVTSNEVTMIIQQTLEIVTQPEDVTLYLGEVATFTVEASGDELSYRWQISKDDGETWSNTPTVSEQYSIKATEERAGWLYRCVITDAYGNSVTSNEVTMIIQQELKIVTQPEDVTLNLGEVATFTVEASGDELSYRWQISKDDGETWSNTSTVSAQYSIKALEERVGWLYRCVITDAYGNSVTSNEVTMIIQQTLEIVTQPEDVTLYLGEVATFTVEASGDELSYRWQISKDDGETWSNTPTVSEEYSIKALVARTGWLYRCVITDAYGNSVTSNEVTMIIQQELVIVTQPEDVTLNLGEVATFTVEASGDELSYRWQISKDDGETWSNTPTVSEEYSIKALVARTGWLYRCVITDAYGNSVTSNEVTMIIQETLEIVTQPEDVTLSLGEVATFTVEASGSELSYRWQISKDDGVTWSNTSTVSAQYSIKALEERVGWLYRCVVTDTYGNSVVSNAVTMIIADKITIITQPENYYGFEGDSVTFIVEAEGNNLSYQWQQSSDQGQTWRDHNSTTAVTAKYTTTLNESSDGKYIRCVITDEDGNVVISEEVIMAINTEKATGFITRNGDTKYRYEDGSYANGLVTIDGELYYFISNKLQYGFFTVDDVRYYFDDESGAAITGLKYVERVGNTYYFQGADGVYIGLLVMEDGIRYFGDVYGIMQTGWRTVDGKKYYFDLDTGLALQGFNTLGDYNSVYYFDGLNGALTGWQTIDSEEYYFNESGIMARGLTTIAGVKYYFDLKTGARDTTEGLRWIGDHRCIYLLSSGGVYSGLKEIDGNLYCFAETTGNALSGLQTIGDYTYYFDETTYTAVTGLVTVNEQVYYFDDSYQMTTGFQKVEGLLYYFSDNGRMYTGYLKDSDGSIYYFDETTGAAVTGWYTSPTGSRYYFDPETGAAVTGWCTIEGIVYCFNESGVQKTDILKDDEGNIYYYAASGETATGWVEVRENIYYFDPTTNTAKIGLQTIDGELYYFNTSGIMQTGMRTLDGETYCFGEDGSAQSGFQIYSTSYLRYFSPETYTMVTGLVEENGDLYYFGDSGAMQTGYLSIDGSYYYFDTKTGAAQTGFVSFYINGVRYTAYADPDTKQLVSGLVTIDGELYSFKDIGTMRTGAYTSDSSTYYFDLVSGKAIQGFRYEDGNIYYYDENSQLVTGLQDIDGNVYSFYTSGNRQTGYATVNALTYIFDADTGIAMSGLVVNPSTGTTYILQSGGGVISGSSTYWGTEYYTNSNGSVRTEQRVTIDEVSHYFDENGERQLGMITFTTSSGTTQTWYFGESEVIQKSAEITTLQEELASACESDGWYEIGGLTYYVQNGELASGVVQIGNEKYGFSELTNVLMTGLRKIDGTYYYLDENGMVVTGMVTIDGVTRYFDEETGAMATGFTWVDGNLYYFLENGALISGEFMIDGAVYSAAGSNGELLVNTGSYDEYGALISNCWQETDEGKCYLDNNGERVTGITTIDDVVCVFNDEGILLDGWLTIGDKTYYSDSSGLLTGWQTIDGNTYYFSEKDGSMAQGICKIDDITYFFSEDGIKETGFITSNNRVYYFTESGASTGWQTIDDNTYYFNSSCVMETGFASIDSNVYFFDENGVQQFGLIEYNGEIYYLDPETGVRLTGLQTIGDELYYYNPTSGARQSGLFTIDGKAYYFDSDGCRQTGFATISGKTYYFCDNDTGYLTGLQELEDGTYLFSNGNGEMRTGYRWIDGVMYYFDTDTGKSVSGIYQNSAGKYYYFNAGGGINYGLQEIDGKQFYFYPTTGVKVDGLQSIGSVLYYFDPDEGMLKNTTVEVSGIEYSLDEDGAATVLGDSDLATMLRAGMNYLGQTYASELDDDGTQLVCSSFVRIMYESIGYNLIGASYQQWYALISDSNSVVFESLDEAQPGDLVFYTDLSCASCDGDCDHWNEIHHIGIYLGNGKMIEAHSDSTGEHPELDCMMIGNVVESETYFISSIVRILQ